MGAFILVIPFLLFVLWLVGIRPYCLKHKQGYTVGANWGVTMWVDWQAAGELAKKEGNRKMMVICRCFLALQIGFIGMIVWLLALQG